ncbi:hypothetical protein SBRCBS47491_005625 [Sporothrix bragantina]|uniref:Carboxylic ester hydrolase n=1 Tax=Sporothrix bragantina TaxID=671064 RepID=A0ABP0BYA1_9PEZI
MDRTLSTTDVPVRFLGAVLLTGRIPWRVAPQDPRVSYALYVPHSAYSVKYTADATVDDIKSRSAADKLPLVVWIHGTARDASPITTDLADFAEANKCACLAPLFPANMDGPSDLDAYKLVLQSRTLRSDLVLLAILDEVAACWPGIATDRIYLGGFSGGGQFAHRFLYLHPDRLAAVGVGAPGRPTFLDETQPWPAGIRDAESLAGKQVDKAAIARVPIQLAIGSEDSAVHGGKEFWVWLKELKAKRAKEAEETGQKEVKETGNTAALPLSFGSRLDSIRELQRQWKEDGIESTLNVVDGFAHEGKGVRPHILEFLKTRIEADAAKE